MEKAYIEKIINLYQYKVRIPRFYQLGGSSRAINTDSLPTAQVCTLPGCIPSYQVGDIVWVEFENGRTDLPVILGSVFVGQSYPVGIELESSVGINDASLTENALKFQKINARLDNLEAKL